jgi:hypothetical protein
MLENKVKISNIVENQIPEFLNEENPLFKEFLNQYYISQEFEYSIVDLAENIPSYKHIDTYSNVGLSTISISLTSDVLAFDDTINVNTTIGFPSKYGLLKVNNEIITYTGITTNSFTGCIRGFSGISQIETEGSPEFLTFSSTSAEEHSSESLVSNLSSIFVQEFFKKYKYQFLPGFENRTFAPGVSVENILTRAKDFYSSKGTDSAIKILFKILFGKNVQIIKPFDNTISPSEAEWISVDEMIVESLNGNPTNLKKTTLYQNSFESPTANGTISNVEDVYLGNKKYYKISFPKSTINGNFLISNKTKVIGNTPSSDVVAVDSTIGFKNSGNFYYLDEQSNVYIEIAYTSKSHNQFFGCIGLESPLNENTPIIDENFVYGYENNDTNLICKMRVVGAISDLSTGVENTKYFLSGDKIKLKYIGEKTSLDDKKFSTWFHNNISYTETQSVVAATNTITTKSPHFLHKGDNVDIIKKSTNSTIVSSSEVSRVLNSTQFQISTGSLDDNTEYYVKKNLNFVSNNLNLNSLLADIQNTFIDKDENTYIAFSGYPSYSALETTNRSKTFTSNSASSGVINISSHGFITGDKIYLETSSGISGITTGYYYVNKLNENSIQLSLSRLNIYSNNFLNFNGSGGNTNTITSADLYGNNLINQDNFKRILKFPENNTNNSPISGPIGVSLNGVELHSPISNDSVFYGQLQKINVLENGSNYDVVNPATISILDSSGSGAQAYPHLSGSIEEIILENPGFNYIELPIVKISGGNGSGCVAEAKMTSYQHYVSFSDSKVNLISNAINLDDDHKFFDGEEVIYTSLGLPIGIGSTGVGFSTSRLTNNAFYYISKNDETSFSIAASKENALTKTNLIDFLSFGNQTHNFTSSKFKNIIDRISIQNPGSSYSNKKVVVDSIAYPPSEKKDIFKTFVGINTYDDYIFAINHNYKNGDLLTYSTSGTSISGLSTSNYYKVTIIDENKFKLSYAGTASSISNADYDNKIYTNLINIGVGTHTFNYPPITVNIFGNTGISSTSIPSYYTATAYATVSGKVENIFLKTGGVGYGVTNIINLIRRPEITLQTGKNASIKAIVNDSGEISDVYIIDRGSEYTTPPILEAIGSGNYAKLKANISNGQISSIEIINGGKGYSKNDTIIRVTPRGSGAIFNAEIQKWSINAVEKYKNILETEQFKGTLQIPSEARFKENKLGSYYASKEIRKILNDNLDENTFEELDELNSHSPIIGWAYDGNPIYGPYGNAKSIPDSSGTGGLKRIVSGYALDVIDDDTLRPSYPNGYFVEDYNFNNSGDLDEHNGRFIVNSDFPNGTYAYFSTLDVNKNPVFPYITFNHNNATDLFNYDVLKNQSDSYLNTGEYKRNITPQGIAEKYKKYPFFDDNFNSNVDLEVILTKKSGISTISVEDGGFDYKVGDDVVFSNAPNVNSSVKEVLGKNIVSIASSEITNNNLVFSFLDKKVTAFSTVPHNFVDGDIIEISGISSALYKSAEGLKTIGVSSIVASLSVSIGNTNTTGITTFISISDPTSNGNFTPNSIIQIDSEQLLILNLDNYNNKYRVQRAYNNTVGSAHTATSIVRLLPKSFTFNNNSSIPTNIQTNYSYYFNPNTSIGIGNSYTNVIVETSGSNNITKSVPPRSIYLPNHKFNTGDLLSYTSIGSTIVASKNSSLTPTFRLNDFGNLYCVKINDEYIGVSTEKVGFTTSYVYFVSYTGTNHNFESIKNQVTGNSKKVNVTVTVDESIDLMAGDNINLNILPKLNQSFNFKFNNVIKKLVVNPVSFASTAVGVGTANSTITINNHNYKTGDVVVYTAASPITPLANNEIYYVIKTSNSSIKLASNSYNASKLDYEYIGISSYGSGTHNLSLINPKLTFYKGNNVSIAVSDTSLSGYDIKFYYDNQFKSEYNSTLIRKYGTIGDSNPSSRINVSIGDSIENQFFYRIEGKDIKFTDTYPSSTNTDVENYSLIEVKQSIYNGSHIISGVGTTSFDFTLVGTAETTTYVSSGFSTAYYSTDSQNTKGKIFSIKTINFGLNLQKIPQISSIRSIEGTDGVLSIESNDIGNIKDVRVSNQGLEFSNNKTLTPKADAYTILKLKNVYKLKTIGISTGGKNYTSAPNVIAVGNSSILTKTSIQGSSVSKIEIISNDSGLSNNIRILPTNNSNGVGIINATSNFKINTLYLKAPLLGFAEFPFNIGNKIFVENVLTTDLGDGYNSSDYNYKYFTVTGINTVSGSEYVSYSISGLGNTGGLFDLTKTFGRVIKVNDLSSFNGELEKITFLEGEKITQLSDNTTAYVSENGWDPEAQTLKVINIDGKFNKDSQIKGSIGNYKSSIDSTYSFDFDLNVNSTVKKDKDWNTDKGKLNFDNQRIQDSDYYQRFSYSIKGEVEYDVWKESVNSLTHTSGFKNFSNLEILNGIGNTSSVKSTDSQIDLNVEIPSLASVNDRLYYDLASEDTNNQSLSKIIKFDSKIITDYNESRTNKVLEIDDISSQFTGITTTLGGQIVGLTSFSLYNNGNTLLYKNFNSSGITTSLSLITITDHEFNTGEVLKYSSNGGTPIGIVTTTVVGVGTTTILPFSVYAIKISKDTIKLAIGSSQASSGIAITFTSSGIGTQHSLSVESELATSRCLITVDNIIQSPLSRKDISVGLSTQVGLTTTTIYLNDISKIQGKSLLKIENEIFKVNLVGVGTTNSLNVIRSYMGSVASAHTVGAAVTVLSGDYTIKDGTIYFSDAPYGPTGIGSLTSKSTFTGRVFYRLNYNTNYIIDDISDLFDSTENQFNLKTNGTTLSGIQTSFGVVLVNNIFQRPFYGDVGSYFESDYQIVGTGQTISFTGSNYEDLPKGGVINEFDVINGSGYQTPYRASAYVTVSIGGTIQSIGLSTGGSGYTAAPRVSIADTLGIGIGVSIVSSITNGIVTSFTIVNPGSGYTTSSPPIVTIDEPYPYKNLPLTGGNGVGAKMNVVVGTGGSIISFDLQNRGYGYNIGDVLTLSGIPFRTGIGTSSFKITVKNKYQSKFSGWTFGQLLELDDFSNLFNGSRKSFLLTRTIVTKEYYSINAQKDSGIILKNNLLIFLNDVLQKPEIDYTFNGGTRITFQEAPKYGSKLKIYFYVGSSEDYLVIDVNQSVKPGDRLRLQKQNNIPSQDERIIYELIASDSVETQTYGGVGIVTDSTFLRPVSWSKQSSDLIIDGQKISKQRDYLEPQIYPSTNIIASVASTDSKIYVKNTYPLFNNLDDLSQTLNDIIIVGLGTTAVSEKIKKVTYSGDCGIIVGIATSATGISTSSPMIIFDINPDPNIPGSVTRPGISTGDYFVIENTIIGSGVTSIKNNSSSVVSVGNSFIDNVYYASNIVSVGSSTLRVYSNVTSISGVNTSTLPNLNSYGTYTWGSINISRNLNSKSFEFYNQNGTAGIETSAHVSRLLQLRLTY